DGAGAANYDGNTDVIGQGGAANFLGRGRGLAALEAVKEISLIAAPDEVNVAPAVAGGISPVSDIVITQCELLKSRFAIVSAVAGANSQDLRPPRDTNYAAFYYPWMTIFDPVSRGPLRIPASGHVTGLIARTDIDRGVHKAPANEVLVSAVDLEL